MDGEGCRLRRWLVSGDGGAGVDVVRFVIDMVSSDDGDDDNGV